MKDRIAPLSDDRPQTYSTTIYDVYTDTDVFFISIPSRTGILPSDPSEPDLERFLRHFEISLLGQRLDASSLSSAIGNIIERAHTRDPEPTFVARFDPRRRIRMSAEREFASYLTVAPVVPFENSPVAGLSLAQISKASGTAMGAYFGYLVAGPGTPLLLITVPAGMIICGAAGGIAHGLEEGLHQRIKRMVAGVNRGIRPRTKKPSDENG